MGQSMHMLMQHFMQEDRVHGTWPGHMGSARAAFKVQAGCHCLTCITRWFLHEGRMRCGELNQTAPME